MKFTCSTCHRTMEWNEELFFCPFCGKAYRGSEQPATMKITVGSDSERTIQEKYWNRTRTAIRDAMVQLWSSLPRFSKITEEEASQMKETPQQYQAQLLENEELSELECCTSTAGFRLEMKKILENVEREYQRRCTLEKLWKKNVEEDRQISAERKAAMEHGEWSVEELEDEHAVDIDAEEAFIQQFCTELAEDLGSMALERLQPELDYDPDKIDWLDWLKDEEDDEEAPVDDFALFPDYALLWTEIRASAPAVIAALESNGLFALTMVHGEASKGFDPRQCAKELQKLKTGDYDPLFGESPEKFIRTFFSGLANLMEYINNLPGYAEIMALSPEQKRRKMQKRLNQIKLDSLLRLIHRWSEILSMELDRLYQSQSENMMDVCSGVAQMGKRLERSNEMPKG